MQIAPFDVHLRLCQTEKDSLLERRRGRRLERYSRQALSATPLSCGASEAHHTCRGASKIKQSIFTTVSETLRFAHTVPKAAPAPYLRTFRYGVSPVRVVSPMGRNGLREDDIIQMPGEKSGHMKKDIIIYGNPVTSGAWYRIYHYTPTTCIKS